MSIRLDSDGIQVMRAQHQQFETLCASAVTYDDLKNIVDTYIKYITEGKYLLMGFVRPVYNKWIGWGIPSNDAIEFIVGGFLQYKKKYSNARLIDFGAGTGCTTLFLREKLMQLGSDATVIPIDLVNPTHIPGKEFIDIIKINNVSAAPKPSDSDYERCQERQVGSIDSFEFQRDDVLLVVWGAGCDTAIAECVTKYGIGCVIIQGERDGGCTYSIETFECANGWSVCYSKPIPSAVSIFETITINTRRAGVCVTGDIPT